MPVVIIIALVAALGGGGVAAASQASLPGEILYPVKILTEDARSTLIINPESKAKLQLKFVSERIAEIEKLLAEKGVELRGLEVAQNQLKENISRVASIVEKQKNKGEDVSILAKELTDQLTLSKSALAQTFKDQKNTLKIKEKDLKAQLKLTREAGDTAGEEALIQEIDQLKAQKELLENKKGDIGDELEAEEEKIEEEMEAQHKAEKAIREAEEEKQEIIDEAAEEGVELPANAFAEFDSLLTQAKSALAAGNFVEAKNLAKRAEKSFDQIEKTIEELEKKQEKKEEAEEAIKEAEDKKQEVLSEASKEGVELPPTAFTKFDRLLAQAKELFAKENYQGAKQLAEQAEDALEDIDKEIEKLEKEKEKQGEEAKDKEERKREQEEAKDQNDEKEER